MFVDSNEIPKGKIIEADLCVIGAGAAGITIAREFVGTKTQVCVLESGGFRADADTQALYDGESSGTFIKPEAQYLRATRLRFFGGTTNMWSGWCPPLDPLDFEKKDWIPHSGWPIGRADLNPYYKRAASVVQLKGFDSSFADHSREKHPPLLQNSDKIRSYLLHQSPPTRFGQVYKDELGEAKNVTVYLNANALEIRAQKDGKTVREIPVSTIKGRKFRVRAKHYILATGGIENARLLLLSDKVQKNGLGNDNDLVGRYFMDHPEIRGLGRFFMTIPDLTMKYYHPHKDKTLGHNVYGVFAASLLTRRKQKLANASLFFSYKEKPKKVGPLGRNLAHLASFLDVPAGKLSEEQMYFGTFKSRSEATPNPASRVTLTDSKDRFGLRKVRLEWLVNERDGESVQRTSEVLAKELGRFGQGRIQVLVNDENRWPSALGGAHHVGTTRMSASPKEGVVDANCQVHGLENLFVAGSSVFTTEGFANPTFTIVALAIRLSDHLKQKLA